jgi:hypothetical protein
MDTQLLIALGRGSSMLLDNLGIPVNVTAAHQQYAERIGKYPGLLTPDESAQAILEFIQADPALTAALQRYLQYPSA